MENFEYLTRKYNCEDIMTKCFDNGKKNFMEYMTEDINTLGNKGWELVSTLPYTGIKSCEPVTTEIIAFFKRKKG